MEFFFLVIFSFYLTRILIHFHLYGVAYAMILWLAILFAL